ncbi:MAG: ribosomal protein S18-alanine N-acetyltransferase [Candidatus Scatovivens sp.]
MEDFIIEKMTNVDLNKIEKDFQKKFDDFWTISILKSELENSNSLYFVAKKKDEIVGFAGILINVDFTEIANIVVRKDFRNLGIGKLLLEKIIKETNKVGKNKIYLEVNENNINAINLYKKYKFEEVGRRKKYYNKKDDAILMNLNNINKLFNK